MVAKFKYIETHETEEDFRPRLIVWRITGNGDRNGEQVSAESSSTLPSALNTNECMLILESIARVSKPIIVLTGRAVLQRPDIHDIVAYGQAVGLKMVVETRARDLDDDVLRRFRPFGGRVFRILLHDEIVEDIDSRFKQSPGFAELVQTVHRLRDAGYEVHFGMIVRRPNVREVAFDLDFAIQESARGLCFHLAFSEPAVGERGVAAEGDSPDDFIARISELKQFLPKNMYYSPQCVKYGFLNGSQETKESNGDEERAHTPEWTHWCLGGKTYVYITEEGKVRLCLGSPIECGDLRAQGYDFKTIWEQSELFRRLRGSKLTCSDVRSEVQRLQTYQEIQDAGYEEQEWKDQ